MVSGSVTPARSGESGTCYTDAGADMGQFTTVTSTYVLGDANNDDATKRLYASRVSIRRDGGQEPKSRSP